MSNRTIYPMVINLLLDVPGNIPIKDLLEYVKNSLEDSFKNNKEICLKEINYAGWKFKEQGR